MRRALLAAVWLLAAALPAAEGFETGTGPWTPEPAPSAGAAAWHRIVNGGCVTAHSGQACMYFGRDGSCDYDDGLIKDASLTAGPVTLTDPAQATLDYWILYQVESIWPGCYDKLMLERSPDGTHWYPLQDLSYTGLSSPDGGSAASGYAGSGGVGAPPLWVHAPPVNLASFLGAPLWLRFRFVSWGGQAGDDLCVGGADASYDAYLGYALDDIRFGEGPPPLALDKRVDPPAAAPGDVLTYSFSLINASAAATDLQLWDSLPAGAVYAGATPWPGTLGPGLVSWAFPAVPPYATVTAQLLLQAPAGTVVPVDWFNTAQASSLGASASSQGVWARIRPAGLSVRKMVDSGDVVSGDTVTFTLVVDNASAVTQSARLTELLPSGFVLNADYPSPPFNAAVPSAWDLTLPPGGYSLLSLEGTVLGLDGQTLTNTAQLWQGGTLLDQAAAAVHVHEPIRPQLTLAALYPNPAPGAAAWGEWAHFVYDSSVDLPVAADVFTVAGEKVRHIEGRGLQNRQGRHQLDWDLRNDAGARVASGVYLVRVYCTLDLQPLPEAFGYQAVIR